MTTRADRERWRRVLAATPSETAPITVPVKRLRGLLDALDAAETCHADCEERHLSAEARAMAAEGERDALAADLRATVERVERAERLIREAKALADADVPHHHGRPCTSGLDHA